ncbi:hypothetical protein [Streptomyces sindenensis]|uniref:hypothetical protein n=1 Tax=Streptomyces sindenensis TaxID=67363 RepID=UPI00167297E1|nr:hypothetical protein [Streptomyces sindenensis]GGP44042.1 hypothetical protein GCM10010231_14000 [Streptomyces sindenensis]
MLRATAREAQVLGRRTVSAGDPVHNGDHVGAEAPWSCSTLAPAGDARTEVNLCRDGVLVKTAAFRPNGLLNARHGRARPFPSVRWDTHTG